MPSYLIAFVISNFDMVENYEGAIQSDRVKHRVYRQKDNYIGSTNYPLKFGEEMLNYMAEYFGYPYTFPKMDQIGIQGHSGAMENWGLVISK